MFKRKVKKRQKKIIEKPINLDEKILVNYFDKKKYRAIMFNDSGEQIATIPLKRSDSSFNHLDKKYIIRYDCNTFFFRSTLFNKFKYFFYNVGCSEPITYDKENNNFVTKFDSTKLNIMLETKVAKDLNNLSNPFARLFTMQNIIIGVIAIAVGWYFLSGGTIS